MEANHGQSAGERQQRRAKESTRECVVSFESGQERYETITPLGIGRLLAELTDEQMRALLEEARRGGRRFRESSARSASDSGP